MVMYITWFRLFVKRLIKQPVFWGQIIVMIMAIAIIQSVSFPSKEVIQVGIMGADCDIMDKLADESVSVNMVEYDDELSLKNDIQSGKLDSGFIIPDEFLADDKIKYYKAPTTRMGEVVKEAIFSVYYARLSEQILLETDEEIYGDIDDKRQDYLLQRNAEILNNEQVLSIDWVQVGEKEGSKEIDMKSFFTKLAAWVFVLFIIVFGRIDFINKNCTGSILESIPRSKRFAMCTINDLAVGTIPIAIAIVCSIN